MVARPTRLLVPLLTAELACFADPDSKLAASAAAPRALEVRDLHGALYAPEEIPRDPVFSLHFPAPPPAQPELSLLLMRGVIGEALAVQLDPGRTRAAAAERALELRVERHAGWLALAPARALEPGAHYSLLWADPDARAGYALATSASPALGARLAESFPGLGEAAAPPNLARALLRFDGYLQGELAAQVWLGDERGAAIAAAVQVVRCGALGLPEGDCAWLTPAHALAPRSGYELAVEPGLASLTGAPLAPLRIAFATGAEDDRRAPQLIAMPCAADERAEGALCTLASEAGVFLRGAVDEPALVALALAAEGTPRTVAGLSYAGGFELAAPLATESTALLRLTDLAGNARELPLTLAPSPDLPSVSIEEVRVDPLGDEPEQEYVELLNFGAAAVSLMGFRLSTDASQPGRALAGASALAPGERALAVAPGFDPRDLSDGALPAGVRVLRLDGPLSLTNAGEALFLRDDRGRRASAAPALTPLVAGQCSARIGRDRRSGRREAFELDPDGRCTPGTFTFDRP